MRNKKEKAEQEQRKEDEERAEIFDQINDNFKKIFTEKGVDEDQLCEFLANVLKITPQEDRSDMAYRMIFDIINWGSYNVFEALGIIEAVKHQYIKVVDSVFEDEAREAEEMMNSDDDEDDD